MEKEPETISRSQLKLAKESFETSWAWSCTPCYLVALSCLGAILAGFWRPEFQFWRFLGAGFLALLIPVALERVGKTIGATERIATQIGGPLLIGLVGYWSTRRMMGESVSPVIAASFWLLVAGLQSLWLWRAQRLGSVTQDCEKAVNSALDSLKGFVELLSKSQGSAGGWKIPDKGEEETIRHVFYKPYCAYSSEYHTSRVDEESFPAEMRAVCSAQATTALSDFLNIHCSGGTKRLPPHSLYLSWCIENGSWVMSPDEFDRNTLHRRKLVALGLARQFLAEQPAEVFDRIRARTRTVDSCRFLATQASVPAMAPELYSRYQAWCRAEDCLELTEKDFDRVVACAVYPNVQVTVQCKACEGRGRHLVTVYRRHKCSDCGGSGQVRATLWREAPVWGTVPTATHVGCPTCQGTGGSSGWDTNEVSCGECAGTGRRLQTIQNEVAVHRLARPL